MASRVARRRPLRAPDDSVPESDDNKDVENEGDEDAPKTRSRKPTAPAKTAAKAPAKKTAKAPAKPRARKTASKDPVRTVARWAVCDNGGKRVAVFEHRHRAAADARLDAMRKDKPGATYYLALVKDVYEPPALVTPA